MFVAVDAQYAESHAGVACLCFSDWSASVIDSEHSTIVHSIEEYTPGEFWRRELPCILQILGELRQPPDVILIDGYVWLDGNGRKGLGAHLYDALGGKSAVVGIAKHLFQSASNAAQVFRGESKRPLYVTSQGIALEVASQGVMAMTGVYRVPTLLKRVDQLARETLRRGSRL